MYLPAQRFITSSIGIQIQEGGKYDQGYDLVDALVKRVSEAFKRLHLNEAYKNAYTSMYLPAQRFITSTISIQIQKGGKDDQGYDLVDAIAKWVSEAFKRLHLDEVYKNALEWAVDILHAMNEPLKQHPYRSLFLSLLICLGPWILMVPLFLLQATFYVVLGTIGFGVAGITGGSPAALYQSFCYGGHTPAGSMFAMLQSTGMHYNVGTVSLWVLVVIRMLAGGLAAYILFGIILVNA